MSILALICTSGLTGFALHHFLFIHGEWHVHAPHILVCHLLFFLILPIAVSDAQWTIIGYLLSLFSSIVIYRLFFHRLNGFPGPFCGRISKIWHMWQVRRSNNHFFLSGLQRKYGPSEITVFHPDIFMAIDGPSSKCIKAEWYDLLHPNYSLVSNRSKADHSARRRQWNRGFTSSVLSQYHQRLLPFLDDLERCIDENIALDRISEVTDLFYWLGFDRMGDLIFGRAFNMLSQQKWHHIVVLLQRGLSFLGPFAPVPWITHLSFRLAPRISILGDWFRMKAWCEDQIIRRMQADWKESNILDIAYFLIEDGPKTLKHQRWLSGDSILAIVAGSEPTAVMLIGIFYMLARYPHHVDIIQSEIHQINVDDPKELALRCQHLEAVILECLRYFPVLPTGGNRKTTKEGFHVAGIYIPPETTVVAPRFSIFRREDCFEQADKFIPERWYKYPEMVRNRAAYTPFGTGCHSCLGRALAMGDMRLVTARLVQKYRFRFPEGENGDAVFENLRDQFTLSLGRLRLIFEARES